jgi:hypothetical protein
MQMNANKDFLGGILKWPDLRDLKKKVREKFGYLPRDVPIENHEYYPLNVPLQIPPRVYPIPRVRIC